MFKGSKPSGQPRSLRSIVESKNESGAFPPEPPLPEDDYGRAYRDEAQTASTERVEQAARTATPAEKSPFKVKGG